MNLFEPSLAHAIELTQGGGEVDSLVYAADPESGQGFELGAVGWVGRPLDPAAALRRIQACVPRRLGGIVIVSAQLRELAGLRQALAEVDAAGSVACDARQAADLLEIVRRPDAVLIDLALEGGQGLALARQLRANPETGDVPLLFLLPERIDCETLRADAERARLLVPYGSEDARRLVNGALARLT
jgi:CheY-like chemotaxis protein